MVVFLNIHHARHLRATIYARDHELRREVIREDLLEFLTFALLQEACGVRLGTLPIQDREEIGCLLQTFANKYGNPVAIRALFALIRSEMPS